MVTYTAPLEDIRFLLHELFDYENTVASLPGYEERPVAYFPDISCQHLAEIFHRGFPSAYPGPAAKVAPGPVASTPPKSAWQTRPR